MKQKAFTLQARLTAALAAILICNTLVAGTAYYRYAYQDIMENYRQTTGALLDKITMYLDDHLEGITSRVDALNSNLSYLDALTQLALTPGDTEYARQLSVMADFLSQLELSDPLIDSCYLYTEYGAFTNFTKLYNEQFQFASSPLYAYFAAHPSVRAAYFEQTQDYVFKTEYPVIPIVFRREAAGSTVYYCIALNTQVLGRYLKENYALFDGICIQRGGQTVMEVDNRMALPLREAAAAEDAGYILTQAQMPRTGWEITLFKSRQELTENLAKMRRLIAAQLVLAAAIALALGRFFTHFITRPIRRLSDTMRRAPQDNFSDRFYYPRADEIGSLADSFNHMSDEINRLVAALTEHIEALKREKENLRREQEAKRIAELRVLQAQINPHFLYNTLNTIAWQAAGQGAMQACQTANLLGKFFRSSLSRGREYGTIREEQQQIASYLEIQRVRYKTKMDFHLDIAEDILDNETVHLVLQPLVENALYHGVKENGRKGLIEVRGRREGDAVRLVVEDNGRGIEPAKLESLNRWLFLGKADSSQGYGIFNVNERVRLSYGPEYGLALESEYGAWTRAVLTLPVRQAQAEEVAPQEGEGT